MASARSSFRRCVDLPHTSHYVLADANVPLVCLEGDVAQQLEGDVDSVARVDIEVEQGRIKAIRPSTSVNGKTPAGNTATCNLRGSMVWPTFIDLHTHIGEMSFRALCHLLLVKLECEELSPGMFTICR